MTNKVELNTLTQVVHKEQAFLTALNENFLRLQQAINDTLSRSGVAPNEMREVLDMNGKDIVNVRVVSEDHPEYDHVVTKRDIIDLIETVEAATTRLDSLVRDAQEALTIYVAENVMPPVIAAKDDAVAAAGEAKGYYDDTKALYDQLGDLVDNLEEVLAIADSLTNINAVADDITNVDTVATNISDVSSVAGALSDIEAVADALVDLLAVKDDLTNIDSVAGDLSNIDAVAGNSANITAVAGNSTNINTVAGDSSAINTLAALSAQITEISENIAGILAASTYAEHAETWAEGSDADVAALGGTHSAKGWAEVAEEASGGYTAGDGISISASKEISTTTQAHSKLVNAVISAEYEIEVSDWDAVTKEATVSVSDLHTTSTVWVAPKPTAANIEAYTDAKIFGSSVAEGALTLTCDTIPSDSVYVIIGVC